MRISIRSERQGWRRGLHFLDAEMRLAAGHCGMRRSRIASSAMKRIPAQAFGEYAPGELAL
jgi:hypothetical protein